MERIKCRRKRCEEGAFQETSFTRSIEKKASLVRAMSVPLGYKGQSRGPMGCV